MNTPPETEQLQVALASLSTAIAKIVSDQVDKTLREILPVKLPANSDDSFAASRLINRKQAAELLNVTPRTVDKWKKRGRLPYLKIGYSVRFKVGDLIGHLDDTSRVVRVPTGRAQRRR